MFTWTWWADTGERLLRTAAAVLASFFVGDVTVLNVDWSAALGLTATATLVTLLFCIGGGAAGAKGTASFGDALVPNDGRHAAPDA